MVANAAEPVFECAAFPLPTFKARDTKEFETAQPATRTLPAGWTPVGSGLSVEPMQTLARGPDSEPLTAVVVVVACRPKTTEAANRVDCYNQGTPQETCWKDGVRIKGPAEEPMDPKAFREE